MVFFFYLVSTSSIFVKTHYGKIDVHIEGEGKDTIVMVHGWLDSWYEYHRMIPLLKDNFVLIIPDLLGHGGSDNSVYGYSPEILAASLIEVLDSFNLSRYYLVGHSLGGDIASIIAWADNKRVEKLFLITPANTSSFRISFVNRISYSYPFIYCIAGCMVFPLYKWGQKNSLYCNKKMFDEEHSRMMYSKHFSNFKKKMESVKITRGAINKEKFSPLILKSRDIPVFVVFAEKDHLVNKGVIRDFEEAGIPYEIYENSGHELTLETPERLSNSINDFFRR